MPIQLAGMASGMDTEAMIDELVKVSSSKKTKLESDQKKLEWKQDAWKDLNKEIYDFYSKQVESLKWESSYLKKKTTIKDTSLASIVSADTAIEGTQTLAVTQLAKTGYLTGGKLSGATTKSTMKDLGLLGDDDKATIKINDTEISINSTTTVSSLLSQFNNAGVTATFDEANQRFFISAKESGAAGDFKLSAADGKGLDVLAGLRLLTSDDASNPEYTYYANLTESDKAAIIAKDKEALEKKYDKSTDALTKANEELQTKKDEKQADLDAFLEQDDYKAALAVAEEDRDDAQKNLIKMAEDMQAEIDKFDVTINANNDTIAANATAKANAEQEATDALEAKITSANKAIAAATAAGAGADGAVRITGQDAKILLNGAEFTSNSNTFNVNGLTITAAGLSDRNADGSYRATTITTSMDTDGIYDKIVSLFDKYNELLSKFEKKYNAESSRDYNMLSKEEKEEMSDDEIELWEGKIKDSLLRKDDSLNRLIDAFQSAMLKGYTIDGKKYNLASFGISTMSYWDSAEYEHNNFHIDGNEKDENVAERADKLKAAIAADPKAVTQFFSKLFSDFYNDLGEIAKGTDNSSRNKFYDDKSLASNYDDYKTKIKDQEKYLSDMETRYRKQFTAMEKAMTTMNSQTSALSGLFAQ